MSRILQALALVVTAGAAAASEPPVSRAEADEVLRTLGAAYRAEDAEGVRRVHGPDGDLATKAVHDAKLAFRDRNAFSWEARMQEERRAPDGSLVLTGVIEMASRHVKESEMRREKRRWHVAFDRRPGQGVVIVGHLPAEGGLLPPDPPWRSATVLGEVRVPGAGKAPDAVELDVTLPLRNRSAEPQELVGFGLHPWAADVQLTADGSAVEARRVEASIDAWTLTLPQPVAPGGTVELRLRYALRQPGAVAASAIGADLVRLYAVAAWLPAIEPLRLGALPERTFDVTVVAPDGMESSMPGVRTRLPAPGPGLHADRFVSEIPSVETPLVARKGTLSTLRLGPQVELDVLRSGSGPDPARAVSHVTTLAAFLEDRLGACPIRRLALVEAGGGGFREGPGWMAMSDLAVPRGDPDRPEGEQAFLFLGLSMARLWVVHRMAPTGPGATDVALGLCEHLVGSWAGAAVRPDIPVTQRALILSYAQLDPQLDRPLLPVVEEPGTPAIFKQGKARMAFDGFELLAGAGAWREVLLQWSAEGRRGGPIGDLIGRMGGTRERDAYVEAFFRRQGACQVRVADVRTLPLPPEEAARRGLDASAWKLVEVEIDNAGLGPVPVEARLEVDQAIREETVVVEEMRSAVIRLVAASPPLRVTLDPRRVLWQARSDDDVHPPSKRPQRAERDLPAGGPMRGDRAGERRDDPRFP